MHRSILKISITEKKLIITTEFLCKPTPLLNILTCVVIYRNFDLGNDIIRMQNFFKKGPKIFVVSEKF